MILIEKQTSQNKITYSAFIEIKKAFDNIDWKIMFPIMKELDLDFRDRIILYNLYENQNEEILIKMRPSAKIRKGVRQGCPLSSLLFNCYVKKSINKVKEKLNRIRIGVKVGGISIPKFRFADNIILLAETEHNLQRALIRII